MEELLERLESMSRRELHAHWWERFDDAKPYTRGTEMLRRQIAWKLQEGRHGGLTTATRRRLRELARSYGKNPKHTPTTPPTLQSGTTLMRTWKGTVHTVKVQTEGFLYKGKSYKGLSKIAREITGTRWSGPLFFGLRKSAKKVNACALHLIDRVAFKRQSTIVSGMNFASMNAYTSKAETSISNSADEYLRDTVRMKKRGSDVSFGSGNAGARASPISPKALPNKARRRILLTCQLVN